MPIQSPNDAVLYQQLDDHVGLVTINRPQARNAVNGDVAAAMESLVLATEADPDTWVVILTGAGDLAFCAGADLKEVSSGRRTGLATERGGFGGFVHAPRTKPWIAAVNGKALAGGCEFALACDLIVAAEDAAFGLPEVLRGLIASAGGLYRLPRALPRNVAIEIALTAGQIDAARAHGFGMVNRLAKPGTVVDEARKLASEIARNAPLAVRTSLQILRQAHDLDDTALRALSDTLAVSNSRTEDFKEGPRAFIEKRAPRWQGR